MSLAYVLTAEQPHQRTQITSANMKTDRFQLPNVCAGPPPFLHLRSQSIKPNCVTDSLNEAVRAMLCGNLPMPTDHCNTSSSDHDIESERLADTIFGVNKSFGDNHIRESFAAEFPTIPFGSSSEQNQDEAQGECSPSSCIAEDCQIDAEDSNTRDFNALFREQLCQMLEGVCSSSSTAYAIEMSLLLDAEKAVAMDRETVRLIAAKNVEQNSRSRRFVMKYLRFAGYDAAVCKSRWEKTIAYPAGDYEFIDVVFEGSKLRNERFFVDTNFREQFEIARPTEEYNALLGQLPTLFVGRADKLFGIIKVMCNAARRSLRERGMCIPPWRKFRYMHFKWVGPYQRTTKPAPADSRTEQGTCNRHCGLFHLPLSVIPVKATGWDASVVHPIEKGDQNATDKNLPAKSKYTKQCMVGKESRDRDRFLRRGEKHRVVKKISALATALADAGLTASSPVSNRTCDLR